MKLSPSQLRALQTLWSPYACQAQIDAKDRMARIAWVSSAIGRHIDSFSDLETSEAAQVIDRWKKELGQEIKSVSRRSTRRLAQAYGTAGRRGQVEKELRLVDGESLGVLNALIASLGWTRERFDTFLRSPKSPVRSGAIRTLAEANRAIWALKNILRHSKAAQGADSLRRAG